VNKINYAIMLFACSECAAYATALLFHICSTSYQWVWKWLF